MFGVGGDAPDAACGEGAAGGFEVGDALVEAVDDDGFEGVELELAGFGGHGDGDVVADHFVGDLGDDFGDHGVDFAGHDGGSGLHGGQVDFAEAGAGAGGEQAQVVADFGEFHGDAFEDAGEVHERADVLGGFDEVHGGDQGQAGDLGQVPAGGFGVAGGCVQAGADGGGAEVDFVDQQVRFGEPEPVLADGDGVGAEFLAEGHGDGVLELGAAHFDDGAESAALAAQASSSSARASRSSRAAKMVPSFTAVG